MSQPERKCRAADEDEPSQCRLRLQKFPNLLSLCWKHWQTLSQCFSKSVLPQVALVRLQASDRPANIATRSERVQSQTGLRSPAIAQSAVAATRLVCKLHPLLPGSTKPGQDAVARRDCWRPRN